MFEPQGSLEERIDKLEKDSEELQDYARRFREAAQEESADRIEDFDILNLSNVGWEDVKAYGTDANDRQDGLANAISSIGSTKKTLLISNQQDVTADATIPSTMTLRFMHGGILNISTSKTVTINGDVEAGLYQIFEGAGTVSWGSQTKVKEIYPQWWGAVADNSTDDHDAIQACITSVMGITSGPKPVVKLVGEYAYTGNIQTLTDGDGLAYGVIISGAAGGRRGDAATIEGLATLTNTGTGSFQFGQVDTVSNRDWMIGSTLKNIQFVGNVNVDVGLLTATNNSIFRNIHVTGYTKSGAIGWHRTGEINSFYDCSMTGNYDGGRSNLGSNASKSNNLNNYYSCVWDYNTRYGDYPIEESGANYFSCLWQGNGDSGYYHTSGGKSVNFWGGWLEANNEDFAGAQLEFAGKTTDNRALGFRICGTEFGTLGTEGIASGTGHISISNTTRAVVEPVWDHAPSPPAYQFVNGGANVGLRVNQPSSKTGSEGAPYLEQTTRTVVGTSYARFNVNNAELGFQDGEGFGGFISHFPGTHETGEAWGREVSGKAVGASGNTNLFTITFADDYGSAYFRLTYTGTSSGGGNLWTGVRAERHIRLATGTATIATVGTDSTLGASAGDSVWTDAAGNTITVAITNGNAATNYGHAVLEFWGGAANLATGSRGVAITVL